MLQRHEEINRIKKSDFTFLTDTQIKVSGQSCELDMP